MADEDNYSIELQHTNRTPSGFQLLSVVVPITKMAGRFENLESWLRCALDCEFEVILVHDLQDEMTQAEIESKFKMINHPRLKVLEGKFKSPGSTRNRGISESTGKWIAFWDADDVPNPLTAKSLVDLSQNQVGVDLIVGSYEIIGPTGQSFIDARHGSLTGIAVNPGIWRMIFKRELIEGKSFSNSNMGEDQEFIVSLKPWKLGIEYSENVLYRYYFGGNHQLTSDKANLRDLVHVTRKLINNLEIDNLKANNFMSTLIIRQILTGLSRSMPGLRNDFIKIAITFTLKYVIFHPVQTAMSICNILKLRAKSHAK